MSCRHQTMFSCEACIKEELRKSFDPNAPTIFKRYRDALKEIDSLREKLLKASSELLNMKEKLKVAEKALSFGVNVMMPEIYSQKTMWPGEVDSFHEMAIEALQKIRGEK